MITGRNLLGQWEDREILAKELSNEFTVVISYPEEMEWKKSEKYEMIVSRCTWQYPAKAEEQEKVQRTIAEFRHYAIENRLKVYNPLIGKGDMQGKGYLLKLYESGYPVIPSVSDWRRLNELGESTEFIVKPINGLGSGGIARMKRDELVDAKPNGIIQPLMSFTSEVSFYFVDEKYIYGLSFTPNRDTARTSPQEFIPSQKEIEFAQRFIKWNAMGPGIQRIDAIKKTDGTLLLLELEDAAQYLNLVNVSPETRTRFLAAFEKSVAEMYAK